MTAYEVLRTDLLASGSRMADEGAALPSELELQALWFAGAFGRDFTTKEGLQVRIVQFGEWNRSSGPDFLHAAVEIDGELHTGPLELDTHQADWEHHGHAINPAFREVILHVVFEAGPRTHFSRSDTGREVPCVVIPLALIEPALRHSGSVPALSHPGRCFHPLAHLPTERVNDLLEHAARFRLGQKALHLHRLEESHGFEEALWQSLARALGYGPNKLAMHLLGQRLPRRQLRDLRGHLNREALLFGVAGFLAPDLHENAPEDSQRYLESLWKAWWKLRPDHETDESRKLPWKLHGMRPTNHPQRRLGALAALSREWSKIATPARTPSARHLKILRDRLMELSHPFWSHHYTLQAKATAKPLSLLGKARANEFLANYSLPRWHHSDPEGAWTELQKLPGAATSDPVRRAATRLFGSRPGKEQFHKKLWQHQALLQIYHDFCLEDSSDCSECPFPEQLSKW